ncbi:MAG: class aldolase/adducin family protein, partial [Frankiales bacterium]|nr:class aldolase/adducin family protein [Frankiales bacterium]
MSITEQQAGTAAAHADELVTAAVTESPAVATGPSGSGKSLFLPLPQTFDSVEEERASRKAKLAATFRMFSKAGLDEGVAGHVTVRDPEFPDSYWVNPFGMHFAMIKSSDLVRVDHSGEVVEGDRAVNGAAVAIHCAVHAARPDVLAAAHAHGPYGKTLSSLDMTIEPLTQDACAFYDDIGTYSDYRGGGALLRGGRANRTGPRRQQGRHPAQPRDAHRRRDRRQRGLVVPHARADGAGPADGLLGSGRARQPAAADRGA